MKALYLKMRKSKALGLASLLLIASKKKRRWMKTWLRREEGFVGHYGILRELKKGDDQCFKNFLRVDQHQFSVLLKLVAPFITKKQPT